MVWITEKYGHMGLSAKTRKELLKNIRNYVQMLGAIGYNEPKINSFKIKKINESIISTN